MRTLSLAVAALFLAGAPAAHAQAKVTCKDGSASTAGRGACSGHGGVAPAIAKVPVAAKAPVAATAPVAAKPAAAKAKVAAKCKDGTAWSGATRSGACSGHGGVATWSRAG